MCFWIKIAALTYTNGCLIFAFSDILFDYFCNLITLLLYLKFKSSKDILMLVNLDGFESVGSHIDYKLSLFNLNLLFSDCLIDLLFNYHN